MSSILTKLLDRIRSLFRKTTYTNFTPEEKMVNEAKGLYKKYSSTIQFILGSPDIPDIEIRVSSDLQIPAATSGITVTLSYNYFSKHEDNGAMIHEFVHAIHRCPRYDNETSWLIEGIADYIRDMLGFQTTTSYPHFEKDKELSGYQTAAHFLFWLEKRKAGSPTVLSKLLISNTYSKNSFYEIFGISLDQLCLEYEAEQETVNG